MGGWDEVLGQIPAGVTRADLPASEAGQDLLLALHRRHADLDAARRLSPAVPGWESLAPLVDAQLARLEAVLGGPVPGAASGAGFAATDLLGGATRPSEVARAVEEHLAHLPVDERACGRWPPPGSGPRPATT
jgi:hypothetical protein